MRLIKTDAEAAELEWDWRFWARPEQLPPSCEWLVWLILTGRGWGKTRTGAEWVRSAVESGRCKRLALVGRTAADVRDVMIEGESGLLAISPLWAMPTYEVSKRRLTWPNGAIATTYTAERPDLLRGPQHDGAWCDELAAWQYPEAWDNLMLGLRLGSLPQVVVTTTPRPTAAIRKLAKHHGTVITHGRTYDNLVNLSPQFRERILEQYEGTRLGRQELDGEILEDVPGALWSYDMIDAARVTEAPDLSRIVVGVDPAVSSTETSAETGIVVAGRTSNGHAYILRDSSGRYTPLQWAQRVLAQDADRIVAEANNGGDLVESNIRTLSQHAPVKLVRAAKGKVARAEPVAGLYEQGRVHHVGIHRHLEEQMCSYDATSGKPSPDRMDALVWALTELMLLDQPFFRLRSFS